jgi:hypothetical protein
LRDQPRIARQAQVDAVAQADAAQGVDHVIAVGHVEDAATGQRFDGLFECVGVVRAAIALRAELADIHGRSANGARRNASPAPQHRRRGRALQQRASRDPGGVLALPRAHAAPSAAPRRPTNHGSSTASR